MRLRLLVLYYRGVLGKPCARHWEDGQWFTSVASAKRVLAFATRSHKRRAIGRAAREHVAFSQGWRCAGCDTLLHPQFEIDHITALADGGSDTVSNLQALCGTCHNIKSNAEWVARSGFSDRA